jgi:5-methylcytosine-specific restriction endonuclease McrA
MTDEEFNALSPERQKQVLNSRKRNQKYVDSGKAKETKAKYYQNNRDIICENVKNYRLENKDLIKEKSKKFRKDNKEKIANDKKLYYENNKDTLAIKGKLYYQNNKDKILTRSKNYAKLYYINNKNRINERNKKWANNNKYKKYIYYKKFIQTKKGKILKIKIDNKRREAKLKVENKNILGLAEIKFIYSKFNHKCFNCESDNRLCLDHHYPLSKGYPMILKNTVILCNKCNASKGNKYPNEWYQPAKLKQLETFFDIATKEEMDQYRKVI